MHAALATPALGRRPPIGVSSPRRIAGIAQVLGAAAPPEGRRHRPRSPRPQPRIRWFRPRRPRPRPRTDQVVVCPMPMQRTLAGRAIPTLGPPLTIGAIRIAEVAVASGAPTERPHLRLRLHPRPRLHRHPRPRPRWRRPRQRPRPQAKDGSPGHGRPAIGIVASPAALGRTRAASPARRSHATPKLASAS